MLAGIHKKFLSSFSQSNLSRKLILSYLLTTLGSLTILTVILLYATQSYFTNSQHSLIYEQAIYAAKQYEDLYARIGDSWDNIPAAVQQGDDPSLLIIADQSMHIKLLRVPQYLLLSQDEATTIQQNMTQSLAGSTVTGNLQGSNSHIFSGYYVCLPLTVHNQIIGALFFADPAVYPQGFSPNSFLANISTVILFTSIGIAIIIILFSVFFVRQIIRPLVLMKQVVDRLSEGNYAERIPEPFPEDELGHLALSFNRMANQIEEDIKILQNQERYRRELTANIAHDLSTPLSSIRGFSEALADGIIQDEQTRINTYKIIIREIERLSLLVKDIQQLSLLESGQIPLDRSVVDLSALINSTLEVIAPQCAEASITIHNQVEPAPILIDADSNRIIQVLLNLFDNARRYTPAGGTITVESTIQHQQAILQIKDTGIGIAAKDLPYIFDRFYRADSSRTHATGGSGLGLAIVKTIINLHGGTIAAESAPDQGTTIIITFPTISAREHLRD